MITKLNVKILSMDGTLIREVEGLGTWSVVANCQGGQPLFSFEFEDEEFSTTCFVIIEEDGPPAEEWTSSLNPKPSGETVQFYANDRVCRTIHDIQCYTLWPGGGAMIHTKGREKQITTNMPVIILKV